MNRLLLIVALLPMTAAAQVRDAGSMLNALELAGFAGMQGVPAPQAPNAPSPMPQSVPVDETAQAVAALVDIVQKSGTAGDSMGETIRKLGIAFNGDSFPTKDVKVVDSDSVKFFTVTAVRGKKDILIEIITKVGVKKLLRTYLISDTGGLLAAAATRKENGTYVAEPISLPDAEAGYREQLDFWLRYYRANLKKP